MKKNTIKRLVMITGKKTKTTGKPTMMRMQKVVITAKTMTRKGSVRMRVTVKKNTSKKMQVNTEKST